MTQTPTTTSSPILSDSAAFTPWDFGGLKLRNRIVMAPMTRRQANPDDGEATAEIAEYYRRRAAGETGLIISEGTHVDSLHAPDTMSVPRFETPAQHAAWKKVVDAVHAAGGAFAPQLWHTGRRALDPIGPSDDEVDGRGDGAPKKKVRAMTRADMDQVRDAFVSAAVAAQNIGCDAIELHGAHGYLLDSFLSASTNHRTDEYGGSAENRRRFPLEVVRAVRAAVGADYPIIFRFSQWMIDNYNEVKFETPAGLEEFVLAVVEAGADILHVSTRRATDIPFPEADPTLTLAGWTKKLSGAPVIAVGAVAATLTMDQAYGDDPTLVADPAPALRLIDEGQADLLAVGRSLIANPDWVQVVRDGDWKQLAPFDKSQLDSLL